MKYQQITVSIPKMGTRLVKDGKTYYIMACQTYQEEGTEIVTNAICLEIDPETGSDLGKESELVKIPAIIVYI